MPGEVRFADVRRMLERAGYRLARIHGSQHYFIKANEQPPSIPVHRAKVKPFYVRKIKKIIEGP